MQSPFLVRPFQLQISDFAKPKMNLFGFSEADARSKYAVTSMPSTFHE